jgi:hypothetical protein
MNSKRKNKKTKNIYVMSKKVNFYHVYGKVKTDDGDTHVVTIVGKLEQSREKVEITQPITVETKPTCFTQGEIKYNVKLLKRKLTLGLSICHPSDTFDEEVGIEIAKRRIEKGEELGSIETNDVTMLTEDAIIAELMVKLNHVMGEIGSYLP